ncbi:MAG: oxidoreductase [Anaerolineae bacterium]|nr:oxidoreductase [Anaerolineae bacterium]
MSDTRWTAKNIPSLEGKIALVTGANSGLGYYATLEMARKGALLIMGCRTKQRAEQAYQQMKAEIPHAKIIIMTLDLSSLESITRFAEAVKTQFTRLDILINNAGVMGIPRRETQDGFEMQFGTNHLGHFALTAHLYPLINSTPDSRIVTVSSMMHQLGHMNFEDLMGQKSYDAWAAYSQSKLANLLFAYELQRRLTAKSSHVLSLAAHPGYAATHLQFVSAEMQGSAFWGWINQTANTLFAQPAWQGALPELYAATASQVKGGSFIGPDGQGGSRGYPKVVKSNARSYNEADARRLWEISEQLTEIGL